MVQLLLDLGADFAAQDNLGRTSLHHAASIGSIPIADALLLKSGPSLKLVRDLDEVTPAQLAIMSGNYNSALFKKLASPEATEDADLQEMLNGGQNHLTNAGSLIQVYVDHVLGLGNYTELLDDTVTALGKEVGWRTNLTRYDNHLHLAKANARLWAASVVPKLKQSFIQTKTFGENYMELYDNAKGKYPELEEDLSKHMTPAQKNEAVKQKVAEKRKLFSEMGADGPMLTLMLANFQKKISQELEAHLRDPEGLAEVKKVIEIVLEQALLARDKASESVTVLESFREKVSVDKDQFDLDKRELLENTEVEAKEQQEKYLKDLKKAIADKGVSTESVENLSAKLNESLSNMQTLNKASLGLQGASLGSSLIAQATSWGANKYSNHVANKVDCTGKCAVINPLLPLITLLITSACISENL